MTRLLLTAFCLSASVAWGQVDWELLSPETRVAVLRDQMKNAPAGGTVTVPPGIYEFGDKEVLLGMNSKPGQPVTIKAEPGKAILRCSQTLRLPTFDANKVMTEKGATSVFIHGFDVILDGVQLESTCPPNRQSTLIGPGWDSPTPRKATFRNCKFYGRAFGTYLWHADFDTHIFEDNNYVVAANVAVGLGRSSGFNAQIVRVAGKGNVFECDPSRSTQHGDVTNAEDGGQDIVMVRGGQFYVEQPLTLIGRGNDDPIGGPLLAGISDHFAGGSVHSLIKTTAPLTVKLTPGKSTKILADVEIGLIGTAPSATGKVLIGGTGSAADGSLLIRRPLPPLKPEGAK